MAGLLYDLLSASSNRITDKECLVYRGKMLTYGQVDEHVTKLAGLLKEAGLEPGERVVVYLEKSIEEVVSILAISRCGGIFVDTNTLLKARQVGHILGDCGARFLITSYRRLKSISSALMEAVKLEAIFACGSRLPLKDVLPAGMILIDYGEAEKAMPLVGPVCRIDCDPAAIIYTSGSTGMPKGVVVSHRNLVAGAESVAAYLHNSPQDRILSILPFSFDYGLNQLTTSLLCGATLVLQNYLGPADIIKALESEQITGLAGIPTIWSQLLLLEWSAERFPALRYITNSGGRFPEFQVREYRRRMPRVQIYLMYGLTEAFRSTYLDPGQVDIRPTSIGKAIPNAEVMILNEQGMQCAPGEIGELVHRGVHVSLGYWNDPEQTGIRFRPNPLQALEIQVRELAAFSGDLAKTDDEGYLYFIGRKDHMIKTSGFRVSPTEIEEYFYSTGVVRDAVAVGVPDDALGETISVVVSLREAGSIGDCELLSLVSREMPSFMVPKAIEIRHELPKNSNGKIDRTAIYQDVLGRFTSDAQHGI